MSLILPCELYRTKVHGCWLGKSIGGTLGGPWEGRTPPYELTFYDPIPTAMLENDDLDLQLVWLARLREAGFPLTATIFAHGWRENIQAWPDEYGTCRRNLDQGLRPPLSGAYDNGFTAGMGAAIRTELWACLAPGDPDLARHLARADARCDHAGEGVWAAEFLVTVESLAFVESDRERLIAAGLRAIPADCRVAAAIRYALDAWERTQDRAAAWKLLDQAHGHQNFTDVAINLAIIVLGWSAGGGDFGKSLLAAVNCGYDADCTCASLGAILGLVAPGSIDEKWKKPIGEDIVLGGYITGIRPPLDLAELTRQTEELARTSLAVHGSATTLSGAASAPLPTRLPVEAIRRLRELEVADELSVLAEHPLHLALRYPTGVRVAPGTTGCFALEVVNTSAQAVELAVELRAPLGWTLDATGFPTARLAPGATCTLAFTAAPSDGPWRPFASWLAITLRINGVAVEFSAGLLMTIPFQIWSLAAVDQTEPLRPGTARLVEATSHTLDLTPFLEPGRTLVLQTEFKDPLGKGVLRRLVVQAPGATRVWLNGEKTHDHDGTWQVGALHRSGVTAVDVACAIPTRLTVVVSGASAGGFFHALGENRGNCNRWISRLEYRR